MIEHTECYMTPFDRAPGHRLASRKMHVHGSKANHFSIKFPSIHLTISDLNQTISCEGSYPLVAFPDPDNLQHMISHRTGSHLVLPSASVVPLTSTTCINASACLRSSKNLFPKPFPSCAPGTKPATSRSSIGTDLLPCIQAP